jgi:hypothetical protein
MEYKTHPYYTHQPFLIETLKLTSGDVIECGCGVGSTSVIKNELNKTGRKLVSIESNLEWLNKYINLADDFHELYHVDASNEDTIETGNKWVNFIKQNNLNNFEVVFLDSSPWLSRKCCLDYFLDKAKVIIIHDFDYFPVNNIIGNIISEKRIIHNNQEIVKYEVKLDGVVKNYKLFYPPDDYFAGATGPPTLICSNIMNDDEFKTFINTIEINSISYY